MRMEKPSGFSTRSISSRATIWPGASPLEVEREIIVKQEEQLKSLVGLFKMESSSQDSYGTITLTFTSCKNATLEYNINGVGSGTIELIRLTFDAVATCEAGQ